MNAESSHSLPYNPVILLWAREWRGKSLEEAGKRLNTNPENIAGWEKGDGAPTVRQARMLSDLYGRSFLEFFLAAPPKLKESALVPDFRLHKGAADPRQEREIWHIQQWAETQRLNALDLLDMLGDTPPAMPEALKASIQSNPEFVAQKVRNAGNFSIHRQLELTWSNRRELPKLIRSAFERLGVLVLRRTDLGNFGVRGLSVAQFPLPAIVFGNEAPTAQSFTLAHEFGHILLNQSGISGPPSARDNSTQAKAIERWCDQFAGAFLIPASAMGERWAKPNQPMPQVGDDTLDSLARAFRVSRHAMLIRLVDLGYVEADFYWNVKRPQFLQDEQKMRERGGVPLYYGTRYLNAQGELYTGLVLEAWGRGIITNDRASRFMGIKNPAHLEDIRREYRA